VLCQQFISQISIFKNQPIGLVDERYVNSTFENLVLCFSIADFYLFEFSLTRQSILFVVAFSNQ